MLYENLLGHIQKIRSMDNMDDLGKIMTTVLTELGFSGFTYIEILDDQIAVHYCTYSTVWQEIYFKNEYGAIDPIVPRMLAADKPFSWDSREYTNDPDKEVREFFNTAETHGIKQGISIPLKKDGPTRVFSVVTPNMELQPDELLIPVRLIAENFNLIYLSLREKAATTLTSGFTEREKQVMTLSALGGTHDDIAWLLDITKRTVEQHAQSARKRIGAVNGLTAIAYMVNMGVIHVNNSGFRLYATPNLFGIPEKSKK